MKKMANKKESSSNHSSFFDPSTKRIPEILTDQQRYDRNKQDLEDYFQRKQIVTQEEERVQQLKDKGRALQYLNKLGTKL